MAFGAPLIACAGEAYLRRRWWAVAAWALPLLLVKEDLGITVTAIGVILMFLPGARKVGAGLLVIGAVAFVLILFVIIPAFNHSGSFDYWGTVSFGHAGPGPVRTFFTGWDVKTVTLLLTFGITGFLAVRSPWVLVGAPTLAWRWIGQNAEYWDTNWHYSLILMPIVFIALLDAIGRIRAGSAAWLRHYTSTRVDVSWPNAGTQGGSNRTRRYLPRSMCWSRPQSVASSHPRLSPRCAAGLSLARPTISSTPTAPPICFTPAASPGRPTPLSAPAESWQLPDTNYGTSPTTRSTVCSPVSVTVSVTSSKKRIRRTRCRCRSRANRRNVV